MLFLLSCTACIAIKRGSIRRPIVILQKIAPFIFTRFKFDRRHPSSLLLRIPLPLLTEWINIVNHFALNNDCRTKPHFNRNYKKLQDLIEISRWWIESNRIVINFRISRLWVCVDVVGQGTTMAACVWLSINRRWFKSTYILRLRLR